MLASEGWLVLREAYLASGERRVTSDEQRQANSDVPD
jgi:hypothetical protein